MIEFVLKAFGLKDEVRTGWVLRGVRDPESVAAHSWGTALLCWLYAPAAEDDNGGQAANRERAVAMAVLHDVAEAEMGDVATRVHPQERTMTTEEKRGREREAFSTVQALLQGRERDAGRHAVQRAPVHPDSETELAGLWEEYELGETATARFVRDMNLCDMCVQALIYQSTGRYDAEAETPAFRHFTNLDEFFETSRRRLSTTVGRTLFAEIEERYREVCDSHPPDAGRKP